MKAYLQMLIWTMLFVIVIEMIFPDSAYKKYLKLVMGCIIVYTLFTPLMAFIPTLDKSYDTYVLEYQQKFGKNGEQGLEEAYEKEVGKQQAVLKEAYEKNMISLIEREVDVEVVQLEIEWQADVDTLQVGAITLLIGDKPKDEHNIGVPQIRIGEKSDTLNGNQENLKNKIKTCLKNFYNVQVCNIYITVQKN